MDKGTLRHMDNLYFLGQNGFIGHTVFNILKEKYNISKDKNCDVLINCAGFSKMYEGLKNPQKMKDVENNILNKINNIKFKRIIHLSSIYCNIYNNIYCDIKKEMENNILNYKNSTILRLSSVIGNGLEKGVVYDVINNRDLFVTKDSFFNIITSIEIANIISYLIENPIYGIINIGASLSISVENIVKILNKNINYGNKKENVDMDINQLKSFYNIKTSEEYIKDFVGKING